MISRSDIETAAKRLTGVIAETRVERHGGLSDLARRPVVLKYEHLQRTGSFKIRGAYNLIAQLPDGVNVVAASAGNHGQGVALAAKLLGHKATIYMPASAPLPKVESTRGYGAEVVLVDGDVNLCLDQAKGHTGGAVFVPPFDDERIIAGQGTVGLEFAAQAPEIDTVVVPIGGGGLIAGVATAFAHTRRDVRVVGVEAVDRVNTMADGIRVKGPSELTAAHIQAYVDEVVRVDEEAISQALVLLLERAKQVVEPAGAAALAAVLAGRVPGDGPVGVVVSGGNIDPLLLVRVVDHGLSAAGRYLVLSVIVRDAPGELARLLAVVATEGLNVLSVDHQRAGSRVGINQTEVRLTLETRDPSHRGEVAEVVRNAGFEAREA
ncbi:MAG TPA: pyridoxal-phosphate dependent enzyme [Acidimicrobiales bacterium]|nr:pyridoxal-phosphate dependent enzyme [Acidimicrobiales bacterium]